MQCLCIFSLQLQLPLLEVDVDVENYIDIAPRNSKQQPLSIILVPEDLQESIKPHMECRVKEWKLTDAEMISTAQQTECCGKACCSTFTLAEIKQERMILHSSNEREVKLQLKRLCIFHGTGKGTSYFFHGQVHQFIHSRAYIAVLRKYAEQHLKFYMEYLKTSYPISTVAHIEAILLERRQED